MIRFEDLLERVRAYTSDEEREFLRRAYVFSALEHKGQVRHSGEPYLVHPLEVASILADMRLDPVAIAAGLLHDVVEDTLTTIEKIQEHFGPEVAHVVEGVTKIGAIPFSSSEERQAENFRKMLLAMVDDIRVILVKLADRLHNMRTLSHMSEDRRQRTAQETLDIYAPIANRLGMSKIKNELEELSFKYLDPAGYQALTAKVENKRKAAEAEIDYLKKTVIAKLSEAEVPVTQVDGRLKRLYSINQKLKRQRIELDQVYDFVALRIITESVKDCYAALGIIHQTWSPVPGRIKDFIAMPRPNGYQSLHTSVISERGVPFEVQIRTEEMHRHAEEGIAAHWKYKEGRIGDHRDERHFQWLRQLLEVQSEVRDPHEFIQNLKVDLYPEEVYIFTPKGQVKAFPRGATPVDFAYAIHTDIGHQCVGARVNGKMVPLRTRLRNGDIVEIVTSSGHKPSRDWMNFVVTARARNKIKHFVQAEERTRSVELGKRLLEKEARRFDLNPATLFESEVFKKVSADYGASDEIFAEIGYGKVAPRKLLTRLVPQEELKEKPPGNGHRVGRPTGSRHGRRRDRDRRRQNQGERYRRPDGRAGSLLQSDPRREDRGLHHARQGRVGALGVVPERHEPALRSRAPHRRRVGQRGRCVALYRPPDDAGRRSEGDSGRRQLTHRRDQHEHHERRSDGRRQRSSRPHQHGRRDQGREAPREGHQAA